MISLFASLFLWAEIECCDGGDLKAVFFVEGELLGELFGNIVELLEELRLS